MYGQRRDLFSSGRVPQNDDFLIACHRGDPLTVPDDRQTCDRVLMAAEHAEWLAHHSAPETDFFPRSGRDPLSIQAEQSGQVVLPFVRAEEGK